MDTVQTISGTALSPLAKRGQGGGYARRRRREKLGFGLQPLRDVLEMCERVRHESAFRVGDYETGTRFRHEAPPKFSWPSLRTLGVNSQTAAIGACGFDEVAYAMARDSVPRSLAPTEHRIKIMCAARASRVSVVGPSPSM